MRGMLFLEVWANKTIECFVFGRLLWITFRSVADLALCPACTKPRLFTQLSQPAGRNRKRHRDLFLSQFTSCFSRLCIKRVPSPLVPLLPFRKQQCAREAGMGH